MKKVLYILVIGALTIGCFSCNKENNKETKEVKVIKEGIAEGTQIVVQSNESMIKEVVENITFNIKINKTHRRGI